MIWWWKGYLFNRLPAHMWCACVCMCNKPNTHWNATDWIKLDYNLIFHKQQNNFWAYNSSMPAQNVCQNCGAPYFFLFASATNVSCFWLFICLFLFFFLLLCLNSICMAVVGWRKPDNMVRCGPNFCRTHIYIVFPYCDLGALASMNSWPICMQYVLGWPNAYCRKFTKPKYQLIESIRCVRLKPYIAFGAFFLLLRSCHISVFAFGGNYSTESERNRMDTIVL